MKSPIEGSEQSQLQGAVREATDVESRRRLIKTGATLLPVILTLRATPAWAQTDYTKTAYRYGVNKGLCRNPGFNPDADANSQASKEFVPCPGNPRPMPHDPLTGGTSGGSRINEQSGGGF